MLGDGGCIGKFLLSFIFFFFLLGESEQHINQPGCQ